ncbi:ParB/RepB/Spo0J family partition protein [Methylorubrum populi]|uniref:ParB/RepB/Spo0J family partition protein n=1 Tax=Methylorubrum populi TaxID=223967 RepID=UPI0011501F21|nr:ParB/RepB/Spo0J family partition protein [Methylorubrum populi]QDI82173.1 ParB/RepB/Spo0J family partition protein [Methylorubrum populi]
MVQALIRVVALGQDDADLEPSIPSIPDDGNVDDLTLDTSGHLITAYTTAVYAGCPGCTRLSTWMHDAYWRTLEYLPWQKRAVAVVIDGWHRVSAAKLIGRPELPAVIADREERELRWLATEANIAHGVPSSELRSAMRSAPT